MNDAANIAEKGAEECADLVTKTMVVMGRKRNRGRRILKCVIALIALAISAVIFWQIYLQTLEPGFKWK